MKNVFESNVGITNDILTAQFPAINSGKVVLFHTEPTKNPQWVSCYMAQKREVASRASGEAKSSTLSGIAKALKGFEASNSNEYIIRHIEVLNVKALADAKLDVGSVIEGAVIGIEDKFDAQTPSQSPVCDKTGTARTHLGAKFYQHTFLADLDNYPGDSVMKVDYVAKAVTAPVTAKEFSVKG